MYKGKFVFMGIMEVFGLIIVNFCVYFSWKEFIEDYIVLIIENVCY